MSNFDFGFGFGAGAGAGAGQQPPLVPAGLAQPDSLLFNPGGQSDAQFAETPAGVTVGHSNTISIGMWVKFDSLGLTQTAYSITGDEDRDPAGAGNEDGNRQATLTLNTSDDYRHQAYQHTYFGNTPPPNQDFTSSPTNTSELTDWNLLVHIIGPDTSVARLNLYSYNATTGQFELSVSNISSRTALSPSTAPLMFGGYRRADNAGDPVLTGTPPAQLFGVLHAHSAFAYIGSIENEINTFWNPEGDHTAPANPTDPLTVTTSATLLGCWSFADVDGTVQDGATIPDRSPNGNDLTLRSEGVAWSAANNLTPGVGDAP